MPKSWLVEVGLSFGLGTTDQVVPSQDKIQVLMTARPYQPAAVQELVEIHDTPRRLPNWGGIPAIDQVVPSHISTRGAIDLVTKLETEPTATQKVVETQDTPSSPKPPSGGGKPGLGLGTTDQVVPSHISTPPPTATQKLVETQDTPLMPGPPPGTTDQVVPSHISMVSPTAAQKLVETQDTPVRLFPNMFGVGLGTTDQVVPSTPPVSMRVWR
jgi:hypothetical protein